MADIKRVSDAVCRRAGIDAPAKANCEANVRKTEIVADCILDKSQAAAIRCINTKMPGAARFAASSAAPAPAATGHDVYVKIKQGLTPSPAELQKIDAAYIQELMKSEEIEFSKRTPADKDKVEELNVLRGLPAADYPTIAAAIAAAKGGPKAQASDLSDHNGFFAEAGCGLALSTATYSDSVTDADSIAKDNSIKTGAFGAGKSPSGAFPGGRCGLSLGYAVKAANDVYIRFGIHGRASGIRQGYENPQFGRSVSDLTQLSGMAFIGVEKYFTPEFSAFLDGRLGFTNNTFDNNADNLQTSAQANQYAKLSQLEGSVLSGGAQVGVAYRLFGLLSAFAALDVYTDATKASAPTEGGGAMDFGLKGAEVTGTVGLRVSK